MKRRPALVGVACGAAVQLLGLGIHLGLAGWPLRPHPACWADPGMAIINAPAQALEHVVRVPAVAPQEIGKVDAATVEAAEARWSPYAFAVLGLAFYAGLGGAVGLVLGRRAAGRGGA
jgi:hypothetical protein